MLSSHSGGTHPAAIKELKQLAGDLQSFRMEKMINMRDALILVFSSLSLLVHVFPGSAEARVLNIPQVAVLLAIDEGIDHQLLDFDKSFLRRSGDQVQPLPIRNPNRPTGKLSNNLLSSSSSSSPVNDIIHKLRMARGFIYSGSTSQQKREGLDHQLDIATSFLRPSGRVPPSPIPNPNRPSGKFSNSLLPSSSSPPVNNVIHKFESREDGIEEKVRNSR